MATYYEGTLYRETTQAKVITFKGMQIQIVRFFVDLSDRAKCQARSSETRLWGKAPLHNVAMARARGTIFRQGSLSKWFLI